MVGDGDGDEVGGVESVDVADGAGALAPAIVAVEGPVEECGHTATATAAARDHSNRTSLSEEPGVTAAGSPNWAGRERGGRCGVSPLLERVEGVAQDVQIVVSLVVGHRGLQGCCGAGEGGCGGVDAQRSQGARDLTSDGAVAAPEFLGDLGVGQTDVVTQHHGGALSRGLADPGG